MRKTKYIKLGNKVIYAPEKVMSLMSASMCIYIERDGNPWESQV